MNFCPVNSRSMKRRKSVISFTTGLRALSDCFTADTTIFSTRSVLMTFRSEKRQFRKVSSSKPISVAFSASHSMRSMFLVGASARCRCPFQKGSCSVFSTTFTTQRFCVAAEMTAR